MPIVNVHIVVEQDMKPQNILETPIVTQIFQLVRKKGSLKLLSA